jgi:hypothetical protein
VEAFRNLEQRGPKCTPATLTALMAAHAWRGNVNRCMDLLDVYHENGWCPDEECYSYVMESVGKAARRLDRSKTISRRGMNALSETYFEAAESILARMEHATDNDGNPIVPGHHFIRNYVEFLCALREVKTGGLVATDFLKKESMTQLVDNKTLWRVALAHANLGDYDKARQFAASTSEILPFMEAKIDEIEQYYSNQVDLPAATEFDE